MITITFSSNKFIHKLFSFYRSIFAFFVPQFPSPDSANQEAEIKDQKSLIGFFPNIKCLYLWARGFLKRYLKLVGARWLASAFRVICINPYQHSPPTAGSPVEGLDDHLVIVLFNFTDKLRLLRGMSACFAIESTSPDSVHKEEEEVLKDLKSLKELPLLLNIASLDSWTRELTREFITIAWKPAYPGDLIGRILSDNHVKRRQTRLHDSSVAGSAEPVAIVPVNFTAPVKASGQAEPLRFCMERFGFVMRYSSLMHQSLCVISPGCL